MPGSLSVNSWKPSWRSCAGCVPMPPQISTTLPAALPGPPSSSTAYSPAARPISLLSPPTNCVYWSVSTLRSSTKTGILASIACCTTPVRPADSFGEIKQRVDLLADQVLDVGDLLLGLVLAVGDDQLDFGMLLGLGDDVLVELGAPRLDRRRLREADLPFLVLRERVALAQTARCSSSERGGERGEPQEFTAFHFAFPPMFRDGVSSDGRSSAAASFCAGRGAAGAESSEGRRHCAPARARCR